MRRLPCKQGAKRRSEQWKRPCDRCPQSKLIKRSCAETPNHLYRLVEHYTRPHEQQQLINISATNFLLGNQLHSVKQKKACTSSEVHAFSFLLHFYFSASFFICSTALVNQTVSKQQHTESKPLWNCFLAASAVSV